MHHYVIQTLTSEGKIGNITIPVVPARREPTHNVLTMLGASSRAHKKKRALALEKVTALITTGSARRHRGSISLSYALYRIEFFDTSTLAVLAEEFDRATGPEELLGFLHDNKDKTDPIIRELASYGTYAVGIHDQMLELLINELRASHPLFAREDLSELKWADREDFLTALRFIVRVYEATTFVVWKQYESMYWNRNGLWVDALSKVPRVDPDLLSTLIENPERMDHIVKKAIGWNPVLVANNVKSIGSSLLSKPGKMLGRK